MIKLNVGDKVKIRKDLKIGLGKETGKPYPVYVTQTMINYAGQTVTIKDINTTGHFHIKEAPKGFLWCKEHLEDFTFIETTPKDILKPGMIIECRNGYRYMYINEEYAISETSYINDVLNTNGIEREWDIVKVYKNPYNTNITSVLKNTSFLCELIWTEKEEKKEMTVTDIEKELGYSIKIIKE